MTAEQEFTRARGEWTQVPVVLAKSDIPDLPTGMWPSMIAFDKRGLPIDVHAGEDHALRTMHVSWSNIRGVRASVAEESSWLVLASSDPFGVVEALETTFTSEKAYWIRVLVQILAANLDGSILHIEADSESPGIGWHRRLGGWRREARRQTCPYCSSQFIGSTSPGSPCPSCLTTGA